MPALSLLLCLLCSTPAQPPRLSHPPQEADALRRIAELLVREQRLVEAEAACAAALRGFEQQANERPEAAGRVRWCRCRNQLARLQSAMQKFDEAAALLAAPVPPVLSIPLPASTALRLELARTEHLASDNCNEAERREEALAHLTKAIGILKELVRDDPGDAEARRELVEVLANHGDTLLHQARFTEGERSYSEAVRLGEQLVAEFPTEPDNTLKLATAYNAQALLVRESGDFPQAVALIRKSIQLLEELAVRFPISRAGGSRCRRPTATWRSR